VIIMAAINDKRVVEFFRLTVDKINLNALNADPEQLLNGDLWYRQDIQQLRFRANNTTYAVTVTAPE
jgi:hypothetical protein